MHVAGADVCNIDQMRDALDAPTTAHGAPYGLIHAAGHMADAPMLAKSTGDVEEVFAPKLHGLRVLDSLLPDGALQVMVLFSSTSTLTAPAGQVDYVAANEYLNAFARSRAGGQDPRHRAGLGHLGRSGHGRRRHGPALGQTPSAPASPCDQPLYDEMGFDPAGNRRLTARLGTDHWIVDQHRTRDGAAILPGTGYLDLAAQALRAQGETAFELRDLYFFRAWRCPRGRATLRATLERTPEGYDFPALRCHAGRVRRAMC